MTNASQKNFTKDKPYYIYVLLTEDNFLYCGYTDDVQKRFEKHKNGLGAKYTKAHKPVKIIFQQKFPTKSAAMKAEIKFKKLSRETKLKVIDGYLTLNEL